MNNIEGERISVGSVAVRPLAMENTMKIDLTAYKSPIQVIAIQNPFKDQVPISVSDAIAEAESIISQPQIAAAPLETKAVLAEAEAIVKPVPVPIVREFPQVTHSPLIIRRNLADYGILGARVEPIVIPGAVSTIDNSHATRTPRQVLIEETVSQQEVIREEIEEEKPEIEQVKERKRVENEQNPVLTKDHHANTNRLVRTINVFINLFQESETGKVSGEQLVNARRGEVDGERSLVLDQLGLHDRSDGSNIRFEEELRHEEFSSLDEALKRVGIINEAHPQVQLGEGGDAVKKEAVEEVLQQPADEVVKPFSKKVVTIVERVVTKLVPKSQVISDQLLQEEVQTEGLTENAPLR